MFSICLLYTSYVTVEGSGGIVCPIDFDNSKLQLEDVIGELDLSSILIADAGLGTINGVVLTAEYMRARDLELKGIIFNNFHPGNVMEEDNIRMCEYYTCLLYTSAARCSTKSRTFQLRNCRSFPQHP